MKLLNLLNDEDITEEEFKTFKHRRAVRIVAFDSDGKVGTIYCKVGSYYELPGGGVEREETLEEGVIREAKEETGCDVKITGEVGIVKEYLKDKKLINETFCYAVNVIGEKDKLNLMQDEIDRGMEIFWFDIDEVIRLINTNKSVSEYATPLQVKYTQVRDITFLKEVKNKIELDLITQ